MPGKRGWVLALTGLLLGSAGGLAVWRGESAASGGVDPAPGVELTPVEAPVVGGLAPDFEASRLDGSAFRMSEARGRTVVVNFWATWCEPCRAEMPLLDSRYDRGDSARVLVVGINAGEPEEEVRAYRDALGLSFPLILDPGNEIEALYRVRGYPTTFFVDQDGMVRQVHMGGMDAATLDTYLAEMELD